MTRTTAIVLAAGLTLPLALAAPLHAQEPNADLPITDITLYRSGVGSFQRTGLVEDDAKIQLRFKTDQINDILKSMVLLDFGGGRIDGVSYASKEPLERRLASFGINIADQPTLGTILARLRGVQARFVRADGTTIEGVILGGETRPEAQGQATAPIQVPYVNVVTEAGIQSINLTSAASIEILDPEIRAELTKALAALAEHRADRTKTVDIALSGDGARQIVVAYVHEMPVWKTSYRLVLPEPTGPQRGDTTDPAAAAAREGGLPTIQGWAMVENTTDEDWNNVRLSLVAGRPVSFEMDLYEPLYLDRPDVPVPIVAGAAPRVYEGGAAFGEHEMLRREVERGQGMLTSGRGLAGQLPPPATSAAPGENAMYDQAAKAGYTASVGFDGRMMSDYAARAIAQGAEAGEVFFYKLDTPVTIERQRSAMLPILSAPIDGRRVSIYARADNAEHPMRGIELTNDTGLQLMPGPISVYDGGTYAGDAQIGHVPAGDTRLLSYAVDLDVRALVKDDAASDVRHIKIVDGLIHQTLKQRSTVTYAFQNKDAKRGRTILIEHPKLRGWELTDPESPAEQTESIYRFELTIDPEGSGTLPVVQERTEVQTLAVTSYDLPTLIAYGRSGKVSQAVIDAVQKAAQMQAEINDVQRHPRRR